MRTRYMIFSTTSTLGPTVDALAKALQVAVSLAFHSQWFTFDPLPDGEYMITVKAEAVHLLPPDGPGNYLEEHLPRTHGDCHICGHTGEDCTANRPRRRRR